MSGTTVEQIARRFIQAWSAGGLEIVDALAARELVVSYSHFPEPIRGAEAFKQVLAQTYDHFPDIQTTAEDVFAAGDRAVVRWSYRGTHRSGELFGLPPSGKQVRVAGITTYRIVDGKVSEERGVVDTFALMLQLGAVPAPAGDSS